jgi:hypothetical protein
MKPRPKRTRIVAAAVAALTVPAITFVVIPGWIDQRVKASRSGPPHAFDLHPAPPFLPEAVALEKARQSLLLDGYDVSVWRASDDDRTKAPDGTPDRYLVRNALDPNSGWIGFRDTSGSDPNGQRIVTVELKSNRVECVVVTPK